MSELLTVCPECHTTVTLEQARVSLPVALYHRDCFEAWHTRRYGQRPSLRRDLRQPLVYEDRCGAVEMAQSA
jgi:hypothetical protein